MVRRARPDPDRLRIVAVDGTGGQDEGGGHQEVARHLRAILNAGKEDAFIFFALPVVRGVRIVAPTVVGNPPLRFLVGMPMAPVIIAMSYVLRNRRRAHHVGMFMVPAAPEQAVGDESCRRQNGENDSEHERNLGTGRHLARVGSSAD